MVQQKHTYSLSRTLLATLSSPWGDNVSLQRGLLITLSFAGLKPTLLGTGRFLKRGTAGENVCALTENAMTLHLTGKKYQ